MPGDKKPPPPKPRWAISIAVLLGLAAAFGGLNRALTDVGWWFIAIGVATLVTVTIMGVRVLVRWRWVPPVAGLAVLVIATTFSFAPGLGYLGFIPNADSMAAFGRLIAAGGESIVNQAVPANPTTGIVFLLTGGAGLLAIVLDVIAQMVRRPALVGIPLLVVLLIPTFFVGAEGNPLAFVLTAGAYLLVLYLDLGEVRVGGALAVGATAVVAALVVPLALPAIAPLKAPENGNGFAVGINTFINLGDDLRRPQVTEVLRYTNENVEPQYLTVSIIQDFRGDKWSPKAPTVNDENFLIDFRSAPGVGPGIEVIERTTQVEIVNMGGHWVPAPYAPTSITELEGNWSYDSDTLSVTSPNLSIRGEQYTVVSERVAPTLVQLRAAASTTSSELDPYLDLPDGLPENVTQTAAEIAAGATNTFDQAIALQDFFTSGAFEYSETAPVADGYDGSSIAIVGRFLEERSGYCIHFASAMAVMARTLGIPARMAVGFTPGEYRRATDDQPAYYTVTTANLHAWPELWFDGIGWVRFEPTPGRGQAPSFDTGVEGLPTTEPTALPTSGPIVAPSDLPTNIPTDHPVDETDESAPQGPADQTVPRIVVAVLAVGALLLVMLPLIPIAVRSVRRQRRFWRVRRHGSAIDAWAELRDTATDLGWKAATLTPREFAIAARKGMPEKVVRSLANLLTALEATAYSPTPENSVARDLRIVRGAMLRSSTRREQLRAAFTPASVQISLRRRSRPTPSPGE